MSDTISTITAVASVVIASMLFYVLAGRLGKTSEGSGTKYAPFTGGEDIPVSRGKYHSDLFVYAALFMVFEVFGLLLASAISSLSLVWPLVFTAAGGIGVILILIWFVQTGGSELV
jgi:NADH:ubiquinone oxidoreductase subunit 3 (subunit A)